jgi:hypothetical protein
MKHLLCSNLVISLLDVKQLFKIDTNASDYVVGTILTHHSHPVTYHSETLSVIQVDIGGHPPIPLGPPPFPLSFLQFSHNLLFLAVFWLLNFQSRFEVLNNVFWENGEKHGISFDVSHANVVFLG